MTEPAGRAFHRCDSLEEMLEAERRTGRSERFEPVHRLAAAALSASFTGTAPVAFSDDQAGAALRLPHLSAADRATVDGLFDMATQQSKGAWWLPESVPLKASFINLPAFYVTAPQWAASAATAYDRRVTFATSPDALACWALLAPLAEAITAPLMLRGPKAGTLDPQARSTAWATVDTSYEALGLGSGAVQDALNAMRPGHGWSRMRSQQQVEARQALVTALAARIQPATVARWRAWQFRPLLDRYYAKARKTAPLAQSVLTKPLQRTLAAFFAGDWLALLDYLEEQPAPGEQITTTLPQPRLYVQASAKVEQVAAQKNLPAADVAQMLASYLGIEEIRSPIERRVTLLQEFWHVFDTAHAAQRPGMRPLTSLISERWLDQGERIPFLTPVYEELLPVRILAEVGELWGTECTPRYPDRIVSSLYPHARMAEAFGPALAFWHNVGLTTWYLCQGPYARTDLAGLAEYHARDTAALAELGAPVSPTLFTELHSAERRLGPVEQIVTSQERHEYAQGYALEISTYGGERRDGFEILRDILTRHRRAWADQHLDALLSRIWQEGLHVASREFNRTIAAKGKPPTVKQFSRTTQSILNLWFGGDLAALYVAIGEVPPGSQERVLLLPYDRAAFGNAVFQALGRRYVPNSAAGTNPGYADSWAAVRLAMEASRFVQLEELLGHPPDAQEFRAHNLTWPDGLEYPHFAAVVHQARQSLPLRRPPGQDNQHQRADMPVAAPTPETQYPHLPAVPAPSHKADQPLQNHNTGGRGPRSLIRRFRGGK